MRWILSAAVVAGALLMSAPANAWDLFGVYGVVANDTGGMIPWSRESERARFAIASDSCARWNKRARITSVHRQYGDYIGFRCLFPPPRWTAHTVLMVRY